MTTKQPYKTTFEADRVIRPLYTGGAVSLSNGAKILATSLGDDAILTDPANGHRLSKIEGDGESITSLIITPSGSHLVTCSRSLGMRIYGLARTADGSSVDATRLRSLKPHGTPVMVLAVDHTSTLLATGGTDGVVKIWDIIGGYATHTYHGPGGLVTSLHFFESQRSSTEMNKSGKKKKKRSDDDVEEEEREREGGGGSSHDTCFRLLSGSQDGKIKVWDLHKRGAVATLESHVSDVTGLDYSPEQNAVVSASRDKTLIWWDARSWKIRRIVPCLELVEAVGFVDEGRLTYCAGAHGNLRYWDTGLGRELTPERPADCNGEGDAITSVIYRPGLPFMLCVQADHTLALYRVPRTRDDAGSPRLLGRMCGTHDEVIDLQYLLPDRSLMALATNAEEIRLVSVSGSETTPSSGDPWSSASTPPYFGRDVGALRGHEDIVITLDVDWSGCWVATGAKDNTAKLWRIDPKGSGDSSSHECYATFSGHAESVGAVALPKTVPADPSSPASSDPLGHPPAFLLTGSRDQTIKKWEVPREARTKDKKGGASRAVFTRKAHDKDINALDVHQAGHLFASASQDKTVKIWSTDGEVQGILRGHRRGVWSIKFSPQGMPVICGDDGPVSGKGVIATASGDRTIKLWSLSDYTCVRTFEGHTNTVLKVVWLRVPEEGDRRKQVLFASAGSDGLVKVWDANSGETECTLDNHEDRVWALAVDPVTNTIASGSSDSTVTFWKDTSSETQLSASRAALRIVEQEQELENFIRTDSYREAITLALQLNHPGRLFGLFTSVVMSSDQEEGSLTGVAAVDDVLATLSDDQLFTLLLRLRDWNTNARTAPVAQRVLHALVRSYPASRISGLAVRGAKGRRSVEEVLHGLRVYTERHYKRLDELMDESYLIEYTLREMDALAPEDDQDVVMGEVRSREVALLGL